MSFVAEFPSSWAKRAGDYIVGGSEDLTDSWFEVSGTAYAQLIDDNYALVIPSGHLPWTTPWYTLSWIEDWEIEWKDAFSGKAIVYPNEDVYYWLDGTAAGLVPATYRLSYTVSTKRLLLKRLDSGVWTTVHDQLLTSSEIPEELSNPDSTMPAPMIAFNNWGNSTNNDIIHYMKVLSGHLDTYSCEPTRHAGFNWAWNVSVDGSTAWSLGVNGGVMAPTGAGDTVGWCCRTDHSTHVLRFPLLGRASGRIPSVLRLIGYNCGWRIVDADDNVLDSGRSSTTSDQYWWGDTLEEGTSDPPSQLALVDGLASPLQGAAEDIDLAPIFADAFRLEIILDEDTSVVNSVSVFMSEAVLDYDFTLDFSSVVEINTAMEVSTNADTASLNPIRSFSYPVDAPSGTDSSSMVGTFRIDVLNELAIESDTVELYSIQAFRYDMELEFSSVVVTPDPLGNAVEDATEFDLMRFLFEVVPLPNATEAKTNADFSTMKKTSDFGTPVESQSESDSADLIVIPSGAFAVLADEPTEYDAASLLAIGVISVVEEPIASDLGSLTFTGDWMKETPKRIGWTKKGVSSSGWTKEVPKQTTFTK